MWPSAYADDDPGWPTEVDPAAAPGLRPRPQPGPDGIELVVDGETWVVRRRGRPGSMTIEFDWVSHPRGYGFGGGAPVTWPPIRDELIDQIRSFMAEVDPATGYLPD